MATPNSRNCPSCPRVQANPNYCVQCTQVPLVDAPVIPPYLYATHNGPSPLGDLDLELGEHSLHWHPGMTTHCVIQHMISHPPAGLPTSWGAILFPVCLHRAFTIYGKTTSSLIVT